MNDGWLIALFFGVPVAFVLCLGTGAFNYRLGYAECKAGMESRYLDK